MKRAFPWIAAALVVFVTFGTVYAIVHQAQRRDANYPQIQIAQDTAAKLNQGKSFQSLTAGETIDPSASLAPFVIIYDKSGKQVATTAKIHGQDINTPIGILKAGKYGDYHAVTWQPQPDARIAAITVAANDYYVLSGRSLKEVEKNEDRTLILAILGGMSALGVLAIGYGLSIVPIDQRK